MPATATNGHIAGVYDINIGLRNSDGYVMGTIADPENPTDGTTSGMYRLKYPVEAGAFNPEAVIAQFYGGQRQRGNRNLGPGPLGSFAMTLTGYDEVFAAIMRDITNDTTSASEFVRSGFNAGQTRRPRFALQMTMTFTTDDNENHFINVYYPNVELSGGGFGANQNGNQNPNPLEYTVSPDFSARTVTGHLYSATTQPEEDEDVGDNMRGPYRLYTTTYIDDGTATEVTLPFLPLTDDTDGSVNMVLRNGSDDLSNVSSINTSTGVVTFTAAGSSGDIVTITVGTGYKTAA